VLLGLSGIWCGNAYWLAAVNSNAKVTTQAARNHPEQINVDLLDAIKSNKFRPLHKISCTHELVEALQSARAKAGNAPVRRTMSQSSAIPSPPSRENLPVPLPTHHDESSKSSEKRFKCPIPECRKLFNRKEHVTRHLKSHSPNAQYQCHICGRRYVRR
jgi:hypothetical protein